MDRRQFIIASVLSTSAFGALPALAATRAASVVLLGEALVPLETPKHYEAWGRAWYRLDESKIGWLDRFEDALPRLVENANFQDGEKAIIEILESQHGEEFQFFLDEIYRQVAREEELLKIVYVDGTFKTGVADPHMLEKWGLETRLDKE